MWTSGNIWEINFEIKWVNLINNEMWKIQYPWLPSGYEEVKQRKFESYICRKNQVKFCMFIWFLSLIMSSDMSVKAFTVKNSKEVTSPELRNSLSFDFLTLVKTRSGKSDSFNAYYGIVLKKRSCHRNFSVDWSGSKILEMISNSIWI